MDVGFGTVWEAVAQAVPDAVAISEPGRRLTYAQFEERAARLAGALAEAGVAPGDTVACYLYNGAAYLETVFAAFKLGAVPVNVNYRYTGAELASLLADAKAAALVFSRALAPHIASALAVGPSTVRALVVADHADRVDVAVDVAGDRDVTAGDPHVPDPATLARCLRLEELATTGPALPRRARPGSDQVFMYTGGTTGRPKGVIWQHSDLLHSIDVPSYGALGRTPPTTLAEAVDIAAYANAQGLAPRTMPVVPLMHGTGLFNTIACLLVGGRAVFGPPGPLRPREVWHTVRTEQVQMIIVAGNAVCRPLVDELVRAEQAGAPHDLRSLRRVLSSGTALSDDLKARLHQRAAVTIIDAIASSEGGPFAFATTHSAGDLPSRFFPVPATKIFDTDDVEVQPGSGAIGVLSYSGPMPLGYHGDAKQSAATFRVIHGMRWSQPGDLVEVRADGSVQFLGRGSGVINTGGEKVHPAEVEEALLSHPGVRDAAVVGVPDPLWGELVGAVVAVGANGDAGVASDLCRDLETHLRARLAGYKLPRRLLVVPELPRTPSGKIELAWVRQAVQEADGPDGADPSAG